MKNFLNEFKKFISKGNVIDLAVGVIIGSAFTAIVNSLVTDIFTPLLSLLGGGTQMESLGITFGIGEHAATLAYGSFLSAVINFLFGPIMLCVYFGVGIMMTIRLRGVQFRRFGMAFRECVGNIGGKDENGKEVGQIKSFKALATALSSCVGNGNIVGIAAAIAIGGPGAIFWMWVASLLGMATKFSEICLAMHYRIQDEAGNFRGGVMYILSRGMKNKTLGKILGGAFAVFTVMVSFISCGALQANTIANSLNGETGIGIPLWVVAIVVLVLDGLVVCGGLKKIANVTTVLTSV